MEDATRFNVQDGDGHMLCPVCGFAGFAYGPAYDEGGGLAGVAICPCCLWEPGFNDSPLASHHAQSSILGSVRAYRQMHFSPPAWHGKADRKPLDWDGERQLSALFVHAPYLR